MNWGAFGAGVAAASLLWGIAWAIYIRKTEPRQAVATDKEVRRSQREEEGLRQIASATINVIQMCDSWLVQYRQSPEQVHPNMIAIKIPGRLKSLREAWANHGQDVRAKAVVRSYQQLHMDETVAWFNGIPDGTTKAGLDEIMRRVEGVRGQAILIGEAARSAAS